MNQEKTGKLDFKRFVEEVSSSYHEERECLGWTFNELSDTLIYNKSTSYGGIKIDVGRIVVDPEIK